MLRIETLKEQDKNHYEEPEGELLEFISEYTNSIAVLTRVESGPPIDTSEYSVVQLANELDDGTWSQSELEQVLEVEKEGKNRKTAIEAIKAQMR